VLNILTIDDKSVDDFMWLRAEVVTSPFVYTFYADDVPIYVGKTKNIWRRIETHMSTDKWRYANRLVLERMQSNVDMDLYEISKINRLKPNMNKLVSTGEICGKVDISPAKTFEFRFDEELTKVVRDFFSLADSIGVRLKVSYGQVRVFLTMHGQIAKNGKKHSVKYSYNTKTKEISFESMSGRKAFDEKVYPVVNQHFGIEV